MIRLSAFADEIAADPAIQVAVLLSEHIHFVEFRSAWETNVLDLSDQQITEVRRIFTANQIGVSALGSPVGKVPIDTSFEAYQQRVERAIVVAQALGTSSIRMFSFYPPTDPADSDYAIWRDEALRRLRLFTERARAAGMILLHENEKGIYGDTIARNVDLLQSINDPAFCSVLDPANYLQCAQTPYPDAYEAILPWLRSVHVKDVRADGKLVVAGAGDARWPELLQRLRQDGYDGFLALEPHLAAAGQYQGFSGPELFRQASQALQHLLQQMNWDYA